MLDLPGPKLRTGEVSGGVELSRGCVYRLGPGNEIPLPHDVLLAIPKTGILKLSDGKLGLKIIRKTKSYVEARALNSGVLMSNQSVNAAHLSYSSAYPTMHDREGIKFGLKNGIDLFALSFVSSARDVEMARKLTGESSILVSKIERKEAVDNFDDIARASDAIMIARGDLGLNMDIAKVPEIQKRLIASSNALGKPVIVATQMLESMTRGPMPTRAEVNDIFASVYEGADAVMLSEETAISINPVGAFKMLKRVISNFDFKSEKLPTYKVVTIQDAITAAAADIISKLGIREVIILTGEGSGVVNLSRYHRDAKIIALTDKKYVLNKLNLTRDVIPMFFKDLDSGIIQLLSDIRNGGEHNKTAIIIRSTKNGKYINSLELVSI
jgi:pyruvate kinase